MPSNPSTVYQLKVSLAGARPAIWRRVLVEPATSFADLHRIIQVSMGWLGCHLHLFQLKNNVLIGDPEEDMDGMMGFINEAHVPLEAAIEQQGPKFKYEYDFGDGWEHEVVLEKVLQQDSGQLLPRCVKAVGQCPPEDVGGLPGFYQFLEVMGDSQHPDHLDVKEWRGGEGFDPEYVNLEQINADLAERDQLFGRFEPNFGLPPVDFQGLSPNQMHELLQNPLDCPSVFGQPIDTDAAAREVHTAPLVRMVEVLFEAMQDKGIRLTPKGNLPLRYVKALMEAGGDAVYPNQLYAGRIRVRSEEQAHRIHLVRILAELAGFTRKNRGRLMLKKAVQARVKKGDWLGIYRDLFRTVMNDFNWAWLDGYEDLDDIQYVGRFGLWLLACHGAQWRPVQDYMADMLQAFPVLPDMVSAEPYATPETIIGSVLHSRMITLYRLLGLLELDPEYTVFMAEEQQQLRRTALFEALFSA